MATPRQAPIRVALVAAVLAATATTSIAPATGTDHATVLVTGTDAEGLSAALDDVGAAAPATGETPVTAADLSPDQQRRLDDDPRIVAIEPNHAAVLEATQTSAPWQLDRLDQRSLPLDTTYTYAEDGTGTLVYVLDTGVRATHEQLAGRVTAGHSVLPGSTDDCHGHGTAVAALAAGTIPGAAKGATIVPVRVFDCDGSGRVDDLLAGLEWVRATHPAGAPGVVNLSFSTPASTAMDTAVTAVLDHGLTVVAAAGNQGGDACGRSPARLPGVVTVGSVDAEDQRAGSSNVGPCVDVMAGGQAVATAGHTADDAVVGVAGTSMAAGVASGVAARLLARTDWAGAGGAAVHRQLLVEAGPGATAPLLHAPPTGPSVPAGSHVGVVHAGTAAVGAAVAGGGCVGGTAGVPLHLRVDVPAGSVVDRVEVLGSGTGGTARLRASTTRAGAAPTTHTLAVLRTGPAASATATTWAADEGPVWLAWTPDDESARLCTLRVAARTGLDPATAVQVLTAPCAVLDTRGGPVPTDQVTVTLDCDLPSGVLALDVHVVAFPGTMPAQLRGDGPAWPVPRSTAGPTSQVVRALPTTGELTVTAGDGHVRLVVVGAHMATPVPAAPGWATEGAAG